MEIKRCGASEVCQEIKAIREGGGKSIKLDKGGSELVHKKY